MNQDIQKQIAVVIPLYNEEESLPELYEWIKKVMLEHQFSYEIFFIDDGSKDNSWKVVKNIIAGDENVRGIRFRRNYGKSGALNVAFSRVNARVVITMDADLQDSPDEIPELYKMIVEDEYDLVSGWKKKRYDPITKTIPTKLFNGVTRKVSGIALNDFNCGLKAYDIDVVKNIEVYGEMHRYIPVLAKWAGFDHIGEKVVQHRERKYGTSKFGLSRFINGFLDLMSIVFITRFGKRPMHFFGPIGTMFFGGGFCIAFYLSYAKIFNNVTRMTDRPIFYLALLFMIVGSQLFLAGFLAELISRSRADRDKYQCREELGFQKK